MKRVLLLSVGPLLLISHDAFAAMSGHIQAQLVISSACQISAGPGALQTPGGGVLDFGRQAPSWTSPLHSGIENSTGDGSLHVRCNPQVRAFTVSINGGTNGDGATRRLSNGRELIPYELSADPSGRARYAIGQTRNFSVSSAAQIPIPIYGAVVAHPKALPAGIYRDTLMVTLDW
ncbi:MULTISPECIES: Csu type fimbrial protein [Pseudomonas]|uniref:Spore coat protein U domain-containing protein n=1 Tax=Pseudomonas donghuensis TaxID=1163398 RepID=A0AAP0XCH1_9PSED|nr:MULTISPECIES: spore coat U domain-containing protein [Pseudomonas]MDF9893140.1 spore coat protein U-like protein [Pseudomonas vranovensis]KDN98642.1 spore coat protein U domain-containing protein [Pseudomonas donghuensis]MBF4207226.1 SCPU domain-containing protein [Pseudomonas donghuensis]MCP6691072.1 spore coat U domain-containing protein [Pseudomonas donghuensis]MCP6696130.1 spore coat U domain-containing protein [Pseudomonas donghuensis]